MGCVASRLEEEEEVVSICRERKRLMKLAVERRYALADAHCKYCHSLYAVSAAIKLFVARHSTPCSPFLITFPPPNCPPSPPSPSAVPEAVTVAETTTTTVITNPMFLQQNPCQPTTNTQDPCCGESSTCCSSSSSTTSSTCEDNVNGGAQEKGNVETGQGQRVEGPPCGGYYYMPMPMPMPSPQRDFGWDFFNPFCGEVMGTGFRPPNCEDDFKAVREEEGIPDLEEEVVGGVGVGVQGESKIMVEKAQNVVIESEKGNGCCKLGVSEGGDLVKAKAMENNSSNVSNQAAEKEKGLTVIETPDSGRELLDALRDIEDHFIRAYDSGKEVSRMLEANKMHMQSGLDEIKENSTKLIQAITWHRSNTSRSSSCKSLVASSSKNSTSWTEYKNDLFDDYGGMAAGSHSLTLGRLYAWEKKLYEEVKAGDSIRKLYERKCAHLRTKDIKGEDTLSVDKTRAAVKDLYSRILVAIRRAESISENIQKLTDEELQPQIIELLQGLTQSWKTMMESHETQNHIIFEVKTFDCPSYGKFCNDSHRLATLQLEAEIQNWRECFAEYIAAQRSYVEALHGWLSKFIVPEVEFGSRGRRSAPPPYRANGPPLYTICHDWLTFMENLPDKAVSVAMKSFVRDVRALWAQQGEEQEQKRKVDKMAKELERKTIAYQKVEGRVHETKLLEYKPQADAGEQNLQSEEDTQPQVDYLSEKKDALENLRRRLELEKEKHQSCMQETQKTTLNGFQTGFSLIFDALVQFSKASLKMYNDLVNSSQILEKDGKPCLQEGTYVTKVLN